MKDSIGSKDFLNDMKDFVRKNQDKPEFQTFIQQNQSNDKFVIKPREEKQIQTKN